MKNLYLDHVCAPLGLSLIFIFCATRVLHRSEILAADFTVQWKAPPGTVRSFFFSQSDPVLFVSSFSRAMVSGFGSSGSGFDSLISARVHAA
jgi:hypothetical protein